MNQTTSHSIKILKPVLDAAQQEQIIVFIAIISILFGVFNAFVVLKVKVSRADEQGQPVDDENENIVKALPWFEEVRENFQRNFRLLFGGGKADIRLEEGEDVLDAGVDERLAPRAALQACATVQRSASHARVRLEERRAETHTFAHNVCLCEMGLWHGR